MANFHSDAIMCGETDLHVVIGQFWKESISLLDQHNHPHPPIWASDSDRGLCQYAPQDASGLWDIGGSQYGSASMDIDITALAYSIIHMGSQGSFEKTHQASGANIPYTFW